MVLLEQRSPRRLLVHRVIDLVDDLFDLAVVAAGPGGGVVTFGVGGLLGVERLLQALLLSSDLDCIFTLERNERETVYNTRLNGSQIKSHQFFVSPGRLSIPHIPHI